MRVRDVTPEMAAIIKGLIVRGWYQHNIAGIWGINQGRVSEINTGKSYLRVTPANDNEVDAFLRSRGVI
jgi:hypothetical protein